MANVTGILKTQHSADPLDRYISEHSLRLTSEQKEIIAYTKTLSESDSIMLGAPDEAQLFQLIIRLMGAKRCIEIGTFTGYTSLTIALALPADGQLITCDVTDEYARQDVWKRAGVQDKIVLKIGPGIEILQKLLEENGRESFDFVFIDADKTNYMNYYQLSMELIRPNGLIVIDNTLWDGKVVDESKTDEFTVAIREVNDFVRDDQRVDVSFLRLGDGTTLCRKK